MSDIITVRASSWGSLFDCSHRWEGVHLLGMRKASGLRAQLGTGIHAGTAAFDQALIDNEPISPNDAAGVFIDTLHNPEQEVDYKSDKLTLKEAEVIGLTLLTKYCTQIAPHMNYVAVEMQLQPLIIDCGNGIKVQLTGTMDRSRVAVSTVGHIVNDVKSGSRIIVQGLVNMRPHIAQTGTYELMYRSTTGNETAGSQITGLQTTAAAAVAVSPVFDAKKVMLGTEDSPGLIEHAGVMFKSGLFPPNPQSMLCSEKYCARWSLCNFHE